MTYHCSMISAMLNGFFCFCGYHDSWWRHLMETFSELLAICAGNSPVPGEFSAQRPVTRSFDVFFDLRPNKRLSKQSWGRWFETLSRSLWHHNNVLFSFRLPADVIQNGRKDLAIFRGVSSVEKEDHPSAYSWFSDTHDFYFGITQRPPTAVVSVSN